eukprot:102711-Lingulodinium_polyedra.AAC.1
MGPKRTFAGDVKVATDKELQSKQRRRARESEQTRKVREAAERSLASHWPDMTVERASQVVNSDGVSLWQT